MPSKYRGKAKDAYERGRERGSNIASWQDLPDVGTTVYTDAEGKQVVTEDNQWDIVQSLAFEAESNDRSFSPFEFTASEFNKARNSETLWEAFDEGITDGIMDNIKQRREAYTK
jgi:hypothetical protein